MIYLLAAWGQKCYECGFFFCFRLNDSQTLWVSALSLIIFFIIYFFLRVVIETICGRYAAKRSHLKVDFPCYVERSRLLSRLEIRPPSIEVFGRLAHFFVY